MTTTSSSAASASTPNVLTALGAGSGIDLKALAQNLVNASRQPQEDPINQDITKSQAKISGYAAINYSLGQVKKSFDAIRNISPATTQKLSVSDSALVGATLSNGASVGNHSLLVKQLAQAQRSYSGGFADATATVNSGTPFQFDLNFPNKAGSSPITISVTDTTLQGVADAINAQSQTSGVTAKVVDVGYPRGNSFHLVITGQQGADQAFSISATSSADQPGVDSLAFGSNGPTLPDQQAQDAAFTLDGETYFRGSNQVTDLIPGLSLDLRGTTTGSPVSISVNRDVSAVKDKIKQLVSDYNDLQSVLDAVSDKNSTLEKVGGSLVGDSTVRSIRDQVRSLIVDSANNGGTGPSPLSKMGVSFTLDGKLQISTRREVGTGTAYYSWNEVVDDDTQMTSYLTDNFDSVMTMLSGDASTGAPGLSGAASIQLQGLTSYGGILQSQSRNANDKITADKDRLAQIEARMALLLESYNKQFAAMDALVGQNKALSSSLTNTFKGMSNQN